MDHSEKSESFSTEELISNLKSSGIEFIGVEADPNKSEVVSNTVRWLIDTGIDDIKEPVISFLEMVQRGEALVMVLPMRDVERAGVLSEQTDKQSLERLNEVSEAVGIGGKHKVILTINDDTVIDCDQFKVTILHELCAHVRGMQSDKWLPDTLDEEIRAVLDTAILFSQLKQSGVDIHDALYDEILLIAQVEGQTAYSLREKIKYMLMHMGY